MPTPPFPEPQPEDPPPPPRGKRSAPTRQDSLLFPRRDPRLLPLPPRALRHEAPPLSAPRRGRAPKPHPLSVATPLSVVPPTWAPPYAEGAGARAGGGGAVYRGAARGWPRELSRERGSGSGSRAGGRPPRRRRRGGAVAAGGGSARSNSSIVNIINTIAGAWQRLGPQPCQEPCLGRRLRAGFAAVAPRQRSRRAGL